MLTGSSKLVARRQKGLEPKGALSNEPPHRRYISRSARLIAALSFMSAWQSEATRGASDHDALPASLATAMIRSDMVILLARSSIIMQHR
jgi:hypothetical protein